MKIDAISYGSHNPYDENHRVSRLRENLTSGSEGEGLETGKSAPRQPFTRQSGFKEIKQDIGSSKSQTRNAYAVMNHMNFSMMAATITWIYGARLENIPERRHKIRGRNSFAFSDLRHIIAKAALTHDFDAVCRTHDKLPRKSFVDMLLRMVA